MEIVIAVVIGGVMGYFSGMVKGYYVGYDKAKTRGFEVFTYLNREIGDGRVVALLDQLNERLLKGEKI